MTTSSLIEQTTTRPVEQIFSPLSGRACHFSMARVNRGFAVALSISICCLVALAQPAAAAPVVADSKTFSGITPAVFECVKATSKKEHNTNYISADGNKGQAVTKVFLIGTVTLDFDLDPAASAIKYTIKSKPDIVRASKIWDGTQDTIDRCK
jgi:hypothetical protein